jgi:hypothetical protein
VRALVPRERIGQRILVIRGHNVLVDADLAELYGVATGTLNQAVKRNADRFPDDFMFRLSAGERDEIVANVGHLGKLRFAPLLPLVFTEQGVAMLSSVLRSPRAVAVNIEIMRAFVRMRQFITTHEGLAKRIEEIDAKFEGRTKEHAAHIEQIYDLLDQLINPPEPPRKGRIGFRSPDEVEADLGSEKPAKNRGKSGVITICDNLKVGVPATSASVRSMPPATIAISTHSALDMGIG